MDNTQLQEYVFVCSKIKELELIKKSLEDSINPDFDEKVEVDWHTISKVTSNRTVLKQNIELSQLVEKFGGGAIKQEANIGYLKTLPEAFEFLELKESSYLKVTKIADAV